jgi:hypothetical protein
VQRATRQSCSRILRALSLHLISKVTEHVQAEILAFAFNRKLLT